MKKILWGFVLCLLISLSNLEQTYANSLGYISEEDHNNNLLENAPDWAAKEIKVQDTWDLGFKGNGVRVAILDSGINNHDDLEVAGRVNCYQGIRDVLYHTPDPCNESNLNDMVGHGSAVAGVLAANHNNSVYGIAPGAEIFSVKITDDEGNTTDESIVAALNWAELNDIDIVSMSYGLNDIFMLVADDKVNEAVESAHNAGILLVVSAGNFGTENPNQNNLNHIPAKHPYVIAVGNTGKYKTGDLARGNISSTGEQIDIAAPGELIYSTTMNNGQFPVNGTSFSTPMVAGALALLKEQYPEDTNEELTQKLYSKAIYLGGANGNGITDWEFGHGLLQADLYEKPILTTGQIYLDYDFEPIDIMYDCPSTSCNAMNIFDDGNYEITRAWKWNDTKESYDWYEVNTPMGSKWVQSPSANDMKQNIIDTIKSDPRFQQTYSYIQPYYNSQGMTNIFTQHEDWYFLPVYKKTYINESNFDTELYYSPYPFSISTDETGIPRLQSDGSTQGVIYYAKYTGSSYYDPNNPSYWDIKKDTIGAVEDGKEFAQINKTYAIPTSFESGTLIRSNGVLNIQNKVKIRDSIIEKIKSDYGFTSYAYKPEKYAELPMQGVLMGHENDYFTVIRENASIGYVYYIYNSPEPFEFYYDDIPNYPNRKFRILSYGDGNTPVYYSRIAPESNDLWSTDVKTLAELKEDAQLGFVNKEQGSGFNIYSGNTIGPFIGEAATPTITNTPLYVAHQSLIDKLRENPKHTYIGLANYGYGEWTLAKLLPSLEGKEHDYFQYVDLYNGHSYPTIYSSAYPFEVSLDANKTVVMQSNMPDQALVYIAYMNTGSTARTYATLTWEEIKNGKKFGQLNENYATSYLYNPSFSIEPSEVFRLTGYQNFEQQQNSISSMLQAMKANQYFRRNFVYKFDEMYTSEKLVSALAGKEDYYYSVLFSQDSNYKLYANIISSPKKFYIDNGTYLYNFAHLFTYGDSQTPVYITKLSGDGWATSTYTVDDINNGNLLPNTFYSLPYRTFTLDGANAEDNLTIREQKQQTIINAIRNHASFQSQSYKESYSLRAMTSALYGFEDYHFAMIAMNSNMPYILYYSEQPFTIDVDVENKIRITSSAPDTAKIYYAFAYNGDNQQWLTSSATFQQVRYLTPGWLPFINETKPTSVIDIVNNIQAN